MVRLMMMMMMMDDDEGCLMMVLVKVMAMAMVMVTPADDGDGDGDGDGDDGDGHGDGDDSGHCRLKHFLGHGLRKLWAVVVPIQLDSRLASRYQLEQDAAYYCPCSRIKNTVEELRRAWTEY